MDPRWLEAFIALAETNSIRAGAARLGVSPATLSDRISSLESYLGVSLLNRSASGSQLSERGKLYYTDALQLLKDWGRITGQVKELNETPVDYLRMVFPGQMIPSHIETFLDSFLARHYHIIPEIYPDREYEIQSSLRNGNVDVYFAFCPSQLDLPDIVHHTVYQTRLCAVVSSEHALAHREAISLSDLDGETLFLSPESKNPYLRNQQIESLQEAGVHFNLMAGNIMPKLQSILVGLNRGIALLPHNFCFAIPGKTTILPLTDSSCHCTIEMFYMAKNNNPAFRLFLDEFLTQEGGIQTYDH